MNHLINEKSPYLLQHASNPVNWYPWGQEAFDCAKAEGKPVFLSIGYSTCHWCHVMAHESFEDQEIADILNRDYICIKVDREERPDIDSVYMTVCQAITGSGGWPLTIVMTPDQKPFWAGTYLPKNNIYGRMGLLELLATITQQWNHNRDKLLSAGKEIVDLLQQHEQTSSKSNEPTKELLHIAANLFRQNYDKRWGGFGYSPKFPTAHNLLFLLRYSVLEHDKSVQEMVEHTLDQMFKGGIFDHVGGGFSRYSTDEKWLVPHFEKMLYDNALLAYTYLEAYQITCRPLYQTIAKRILDYVLGELTDNQGGFYCGQDADSDGVEGKYYVFTPSELQQVLGETNSKSFCQWFDVTDNGNFEGKSILNLIKNERYQENNADIESLCKKVYVYRLTRAPLHKDDKILTSWNSLMIAALAKASRLLNEPLYLQAAQKSQQFIASHLTDMNGRLFVRWRDGEFAHAGQLDDYAFYAFALLELYQTTFDVSYLQKAIFTGQQLLDLFLDESSNGFYLYANDSEQLISRPKGVYDGALPSGNSIASVVLTKLAKITGEIKWQEASNKQINFITSTLQNNPSAYCVSLLSLISILYPSQELVCVTSEQSCPPELLVLLRENALPNLTVLVKTKENQQELAQAAPFTASYHIPESGSAYYLCKNGTCAAPTQYLEDFRKQLLEN